MIATLTWITAVVVVAIVAVVAHHLIFIAIALWRTSQALAALAGGLIKVRDDAGPLGERMTAINGGLVVLKERLLQVNGNLASIVALARGA
jgi:hypothetical protein